MKINQEKLTYLVYEAILKMFDDSDPDLLNPDFLNDPEQLTKFFYALSITGPHEFFNQLAKRKISINEFYSLMGVAFPEI